MLKNYISNSDYYMNIIIFLYFIKHDKRITLYIFVSSE